MLRRCSLTLCLLALAGTASGHYQKAFWAGPYLFSLYNFSQGNLRPGANHIGLRVQDRDYRILTRLRSVSVACAFGPKVIFAPGPGKDYCGWILFPGSGVYLLDIQVKFEGYKEFRFQHRVVVRKRYY